MKRIAAVTVIVVFLAASMAVAGDLHPSIVVPTMIHDFGQVFERGAYKYTFVVRNRGKADLVIQSVKPG